MTSLNNKNLDFSYEDIRDVSRSAFSSTNETWFYACRTALENSYSMSFAERWNQQVGGTTFAYEVRTDYSKMNREESLRDKINRNLWGFNPNGSRHLPIGVDGEQAFAFMS